MNLIDQLKQIPDPRSTHGKRYPLWWLLWLVILGSLCGYRGYRPLQDFCQANWQSVCQLTPVPIHLECPSYSTFRRLFQQVDYRFLTEIFHRWCQQWLSPCSGSWVGGDGKSIRCTRQDARGANFINTVSLFTHTTGTVIALAVMENAATSEIVVMRQLIKSLAGIEVTYTLDALHCQKATVQLIAQQQQHYLIALKGNQKLLWRTLTLWVRQVSPLSVAQTIDTTHAREVTRTVSVYEVPPAFSQWTNWQRVVWVERSGRREGKSFCHQTGYITDLTLSAEEFLPHLQDRWRIENLLHWVRDVTFSEDTPVRTGDNAPVNWAVLHCWVINLVRQLGYRTVPQGMRVMTNQIHQVFHILFYGFSSA